MKKYKGNLRSKNSSSKTKTEKGAALVVVILVMLILMGFVAIVLSRVNSETVITSNDAAENRSFNAAQALVESNSQDFATLFQRKLAPTTTDIDTIRNATVTGFEDYDFSRKFVTQKKDSETIQIPDGDYAGLFSIRDEWEIDVTAKDLRTGVESRVKRSFNNDRIPLFQFGMFYEDDLELNRPPMFTFGGRVHTNASLFISANKINANPPGGIYFNSKATVVGEVVNDIWKFGTALSAGTDDQNGVMFADTGGTYRELLTHKGSVKCVNPSGPNVFADRPNLPNCSNRPDWYTTDKLVFQGNLDNHKPRLNLPLYRLGVNLVELVKRGKNVGDRVSNGTANPALVTAATSDDAVLSFERFANKPGIRISLADAQNRLPGCANVTGPDPNNNLCGVRLDINGGYQPTAMTDGANYRTTRLNATRFAQVNKQMWIKVEIVNYNYDTGVPITTDITEDILSLGVTESAPYTSNFQIAGHTQNGASNTSFNDSRSIIKLQRFTIQGPSITNTGTKYMSNRSIGGINHNFVERFKNVTPIPAIPLPVVAPPTGCNVAVGTPTASDAFSAPPPSPQYASTSTDERTNHLYCVRYSNGALDSYTNTVTPFPIQMFDTREGIVQDRPAANNSVPGTDSFGTDNVTRAGAMSMIDIDVANLRKFLNGGANSFDGLFPTTTRFATSFTPSRALLSTDIPQNKGWVVYVSDRRGDADFDGEYDMEDVISDGVQQFNEDINGTGVFNPGNGVFERLFFDSNNNFFEAPRYNETLPKTQAASTDHGYYRRGVRLINGGVLPGSYDRLNPTQTRGFTFASENGVYVKGNYNAESVTLTGTTAPAPPQNYFPQGGSLTQAGSANALNHVPAAVVSDAATILSNAWNDSQSFATPFAQESRVASPTVMRFALLTGDVVTGRNGTTTVSPSATGGLGNGGVHNFKRYLEVWTGVRLNYTGSLVNLFNSRNNNSFFKCCEAVYNPPIRDWSFDTTFLEPNRLPPGTPYIYSMSLTGFQRVNE